MGRGVSELANGAGAGAQLETTPIQIVAYPVVGQKFQDQVSVQPVPDSVVEPLKTLSTIGITNIEEDVVRKTESLAAMLGYAVTSDSNPEGSALWGCHEEEGVVVPAVPLRHSLI